MIKLTINNLNLILVVVLVEGDEVLVAKVVVARQEFAESFLSIILIMATIVMTIMMLIVKSLNPTSKVSMFRIRALAFSSKSRPGPIALFDL